MPKSDNCLGVLQVEAQKLAYPIAYCIPNRYKYGYPGRSGREEIPGRGKERTKHLWQPLKIQLYFELLPIVL